MCQIGGKWKAAARRTQTGGHDSGKHSNGAVEHGALHLLTALSAEPGSRGWAKLQCMFSFMRRDDKSELLQSQWIRRQINLSPNVLVDTVEVALCSRRHTASQQELTQILLMLVNLQSGKLGMLLWHSSVDSSDHSMTNIVPAASSVPQEGQRSSRPRKETPRPD
ncbi:hypothetical protein N658DRAFT_88240 [Parathielavia hyrcaniae]|uniref:Uncharacterized protein n=1 Tax=Parathielavia hyrcaniae TaxID=113614 RepID=A0AAN6Q4P1_9PEZI|nr:hypothetical protein N658DRAFT_88240 [Parathielavia hyrcaniae]